MPTTISHKEINLQRLVLRLEKSISNPQSTNDPLRPFKVQGMLQSVKHARRLLRDLELTDGTVEPQKAEHLNNTKSTLDKVQSFFESIHEDTIPITNPESILARIPPPNMVGSSSSSQECIVAPKTSGADLLLPSEESWADSFSPLPTTTSPISSEAINISSSGNPTTDIVPPPSFLQNSQQIQEELSNQLAQMSTQLRRNATHFSKALENDKAIMEQTEMKLDGNMGNMVKEKGRLRDYARKTSGSAFMTFLIMLLVGFFFMAMVALIRMTRW